ncbi:MAG: ATPase [Gammaproteobacteria bacterium CG11_big_fil_rev_8_21_14_0_20_46_22]|nr:MAG: ATPase [Gammaproteobacteria bacterium CG12_big_fil_rev_8_21_14_0_65_46_12]PIR10711.1 MAG: ATPase [Gammaproteobacteria bacterium CG11_big_fil_rev_8_21_14_0_20_46_22]
MVGRFVGRTQELNSLQAWYTEKVAKFVAIKGRRRIGKSRLIAEFAKSKLLYRFVGLAPEEGITAQDQRDEFARRLSVYFPDLPTLKADNWAELFSILARRVHQGSIILLLDEISWMAEGDSTFLAKLKNAWDDEFKLNQRLMLIVCGSVSSWIDKNLLSASGFIGRIHHVLTLKELPLALCSEFWAGYKNHVSATDKLKYLAISGGVPLYLECLDPKLPVDENIKQLCYTDGGLLLREFDNIFHDLFGKRSNMYKKIVSALLKEPADMAKICQHLSIQPSGLISEYLSDLVEAGFISRDFTWLVKAGNFSKLSRYRLSDNYLRFYLRYLDKEKIKIEKGLYEGKSIALLPEWSTIMGLQFENLVLSNRKTIWQQLGITANDVVIDGAYFQRKTIKQRGCQIDYMIQTRFNNLFVCEIKFSRNEVKTDVIEAMTEKIQRLSKPRGFSCFPVLIHVNGVSDALVDAAYFTKIIDFSEFLN